METLQVNLSVYPFFADLPGHHIEAVAGCASNVRFEAGSFIFHEGEEAERFYLIREGKVVLQICSDRRGPLNILTLEEGDILGWSWLFPPYYWHFAARATEPTKAIFFYGTRLREQCEEDHDLGYELMKRFARIIEQRLDATRWQLLDVYGVRS